MTLATSTTNMPSSSPDLATRLVALAVPAALGALSALHVAWGLGSHWPASSERALATRVLGEAQMPPAAASLAVAAALLVAGVVVRRAAGSGASTTVRRAALGVSAVLLLRGVAFIPLDLANGLSEPFARWDLVLYSPLCLALGAGALFLARPGGHKAPAPDTATRRSFRDVR